MSSMFYNCLSLKKLPNISKWNISNVNNMSFMFYNCITLTELPDISKWNTCKVNNMNSIFEGCSSLKELPDISKWNTSNVNSMNSIFSQNIKKKLFLLFPFVNELKHTLNQHINIINIEDNPFCCFSSLKKLPDISKWNTSNVNNMSSMFEGCIKKKRITRYFKMEYK